MFKSVNEITNYLKIKYSKKETVVCKAKYKNNKNTTLLIRDIKRKIDKNKGKKFCLIGISILYNIEMIINEFSDDKYNITHINPNRIVIEYNNNEYVIYLKTYNSEVRGMRFDYLYLDDYCYKYKYIILYFCQRQTYIMKRD